MVFILIIVATIQIISLKNAFQTSQQVTSSYEFFPFEFSFPNLKQNGYILDQKGKIFSEIYGEENRIVLNHEEIPQKIKDLFIYTEDRNFHIKDLTLSELHALFYHLNQSKDCLRW